MVMKHKDMYMLLDSVLRTTFDNNHSEKMSYNIFEKILQNFRNY